MALSSKRDNTKVSKYKHESIKYAHVFLLIIYGYITVLTPNMQSFDSNGIKFLALSILNLITFAFLFSRKGFTTKTEVYNKYFSNTIGFIYTLLMVISLLSFFKSINILESIVHFSKIFTTFIAAFLISILLREERRSLLILSLAMTCLLIWDSFNVYLGISKYISGEFSTVYDIRSVYSHKNIFAASIFLKIPFAWWLIVFHTKGIRWFGIVAFYLAQLAIFIITARTFYLGTIILNLFLLSFFVYSYLKFRNKLYLRNIAVVFIVLILSGMTFTLIQKNLYPKVNDRFATSIGTRLTTINTNNGEAMSRIKGWERSLHLIEKDPILGVGLGNWKLTSLKEENLTNGGFSLHYKAHNDFIETTTEVGILGGILFLLLFLIPALNFLKRILKRASDDEIMYPFLFVFGLLAYSFDAMFNFPQDRPEIAALFAMYVGMASIDSGINTLGIKVRSRLKKLEIINYSIKLNILFTVTFIILMIGSTYILTENFKSLRVQLVVGTEIRNNKLITSADRILKEFPWIPNVNVVGEPIAVQKARYLIKENRFDEAIAILYKDQSSPYDSRREFFLSECYMKKNMLDSALKYTAIVNEIKPRFYFNVDKYCRMLLQADKTDEGKRVINNYLSNVKNNGKAWLLGYNYYATLGEINRAKALLDSANFYMKGNKEFNGEKDVMGFYVSDVFYDASFEKAMEAYNDKEFLTAINLFSLIIESKDECDECRIRRAFAYYSVMEYNNSATDLEYLINKGIKLPNIFNLLGVDYYLLGNNDAACENFEKAKNLGDPQGIINFQKYCQEID